MRHLKINNRILRIKLIIFFSIVMVVTIYLKTYLATGIHLRSPLDIELSEASLDLVLLNTKGQMTSLREILSIHESIWVYFFSPNCLTCNRICENISKKDLPNFIGIAFTSPSFLLEYQKKSNIMFPLYSVSPRNANIIGIYRVPYLVEVNRHGNIQSKFIKTKDILEVFH